MTTAYPAVPYYFQSEEVRTISIGNSPWFVARDICNILSLSNISMALERIPDTHKGINQIDTLGGVQQMAIVSEPGLYRLIIRSDKPQAEPFMEWITGEVLPAIRKTGQYSLANHYEPFVPATEGTAAISVPRLEEAARGVKAAMIMARAYGWKTEDARQYANKVVLDITGIDTLALLNIPVKQGMATPPLRDPREELTQIVGQYLEERCAIDVSERVSSTELYTDFTNWFMNFHVGEIPTQALFGSIMSNYRRRVKSGGIIFYSGIAVRNMEVQA